MLYLLLHIDFTAVKKANNIIVDFSLLLSIPVNSPSIPRYLSTVFGFAVPSAGIPGIGKYA